jgi:glycosyltransferase involved in cell wall biosynthesis
MKVCVVIPAYNEYQTIGSVLSEIKNKGLDALIIDDGSCDNTASVANNYGFKILINLSNMGKGAALINGFKYVAENNFDAVITMDADGQHLPSEIDSFINSAAATKSGIIIGNRMSKSANMPLVRLLTNKFMSWLISKISGQNIPDTQCGFRLIKTEVLKRLSLHTSNFEIESEMIIQAARLGYKIESIPITTVYTGYTGCKSKINPIIDTLRFFSFIAKELWITRR